MFIFTFNVEQVVVTTDNTENVAIGSIHTMSCRHHKVSADDGTATDVSSAIAVTSEHLK